MPPDDRTPRVPQGPIGAYLIKNLEQLRKARRLSYQDLAVRLQGIGRPIPALGLSRIEKGTRRVDADDLVGLALALEVNPSALLLPRDVPPDGLVTLVDDSPTSAADAWAWADGRRPLPFPGPFTRSNMDIQVAVDFATHARPEWAPLPEVLTAMGISLRPAVVAAIVTSPLGVLVGRRVDGQPPWTFFAGEQEPGELPADTAIREVKEEAALRIAAGNVIGRRVHPKTGRTMMYLAAWPTHGTDVFVGDEAELAEVRWVGLAELGALMPDLFGPVREHLARELGEA